jgi:adenosylcobinamide kinase/adenosylcobinamide-phosphate guanylyltransferase
MGKVVLVLGGARSGKSAFALREASAASGARKAYVATARPEDEEMRERIERHRRERGEDWWTVEEPVALPSALIALAEEGFGTIVLDCLTLWLSNLLARGEDVPVRTEELLSALEQARSGASLFIVSNEVGTGIVPEGALARRFRDDAGWLNQKVAARADEAYLVVAGLTVKLKE